MNGAQLRPLAGVIVIDKPQGPTSHDVVARVRRALGTRAVGHAGTLDPMATGVLVLAAGEATKLVPWLTAARKRYEARVLFGTETDTLDADGHATRTVAVGPELRDALAAGREAPLLRAAIEVERRRTSQVPPSYSAVHADGERAYARARRGEIVVLEPREVHAHTVEIVATSVDPPGLSLAIEVSKGYYVRSLARDLSGALGTVGHLVSLRRTRSGCFDIGEAIALDSPPEVLVSRVLSVAQAAARILPIAHLTEPGSAHARSGRLVPPGELEPTGPGTCAWLDPEGALVAIGEVDDRGAGRVIRGFAR
jgi:tRNA pseudouridine55 synthase